MLKMMGILFAVGGCGDGDGGAAGSTWCRNEENRFDRSRIGRTASQVPPLSKRKANGR